MSVTNTFVGKKVLVTGAAGFIGGHVAAALAGHGCHLTMLDRNDAHAKAGVLGSSRIFWKVTSILAPDFPSWLVEEQFDYVLHFAGNANVAQSVQDPEHDFDVNVRASVAMLEAIRRSGAPTVLLYASSAAVYGNPSRLPIAEQDATVPISPYGVGKLAMERYLAVYCRLYGVRGASVRLFSPFGPRLRKQIVFDLMQRIASRPAALEVFGRPTQTRDFIYIDDVVSAILHVLGRGALDGTTYNIGRGIQTQISEVVGHLVTAMSPGLRVKYQYETMPGYPDAWQANIDRVTALGWQPQVGLAEGILRTVEWYEHEYS